MCVVIIVGGGMGWGGMGWDGMGLYVCMVFGWLGVERREGEVQVEVGGGGGGGGVEG